jgi:prepilin-type processing-associated H-X9-DG protein
MLTSSCEDLLYMADQPPSLSAEEVLHISDQPPPIPQTRKRRRVGRWIALAALVGPASLLIVIAVVNADRESRRGKCADQLKRIGVALGEYESAHGHFPAPCIARADGTPLLSWRVAILPFLGYRSLYDRFRLDEPWDSPHNRSLLREMPAEFACPSGPARRQGQTGYLVIVGPVTEFGSVNTAFEPTRGVDIREMTDGTSNSVLVFETDAPVPWTKPDDLHWAPSWPAPRIASAHKGGTHILFADGGTRFVKTTIDPRILVGLFTINGNEVLSSA